MATETEIYRIIVETQGGRELLALNRTLQATAKNVQVAARGTQQFSNSMNLLGKTTRSVGQRNAALTNVAYQISDIAVQLEMGTDAGRIFAQQMPQLLGGFGLLGAAVGALAAIIPTAIRLLGKDMVDGLEKVRKQLESSNDALEEYNRIVKLSSGSARELGEEFGSSSQFIKLFVNDLKQLNEIKINEELDRIATIVGGLVAGQGMGGKTRMQRVRDDLLNIRSSVGSANRKPVEQFLALLDELESGGTDSDRRIEIFAELNRLVKESAGSVGQATANQRAFLQATAEVALQYEKIVAAQERARGVVYEQYQASREAARLAQLQEESEARKSQQAYATYYALRSIGEQEELNARYAENTSRAYQQYYDSLAKAAALQRSDNRSQQAQIVYYRTRQIGEEMVKAANEANRLAGELAGAAANASRVYNAIMDLQSATRSITLTNVARAAELNALQGGATVEYARAAADFAEEEAKLTAALQGARTTGEIQAASQELEAFKAARGEQLRIEGEINAELERRRKLEEASTGGGGASKVDDANKELKDYLETLKGFRYESEVAREKIAELEAGFEKFKGSLSAEEIELFRRGIEKLSTEVDDIAKEWYNAGEVIESSIVDGLTSVLHQTSSVKEAAVDMFRTINQYASRIIAMRIFENIFGGPGGSGNWFDMILGTGRRSAVVPATAAAAGLGRSGGDAQMMRAGIFGRTIPNIMPSSSKGGNSTPKVTVNNYAGAEVEVTRTSEEVIEIAVKRATEAVKGEFTRSMRTGHGAYSQGIETGYNTRRRLG